LLGDWLNLTRSPIFYNNVHLIANKIAMATKTTQPGCLPLVPINTRKEPESIEAKIVFSINN
jgi:hypothetical protein